MSVTGCITAGSTFFLDPFASRQWDDPQYQGTKMTINKVRFVEKIHEVYESGSCPLRDGYAPFCKHLFVKNFTEAKTGTVKITKTNEHLLKSGYSARRPEELPVLSRWFASEDVECPIASFLDVILYSRDQILKESESLPSNERYEIPNIPWGIISIKAQMEDCETPMNPITMMRNALGKEYGGSGVSMDQKKYMESVEYFSNHATVI